MSPFAPRKATLRQVILSQFLTPSGAGVPARGGPPHSENKLTPSGSGIPARTRNFLCRARIRSPGDEMIRYFLVLAVTGGSLLAADFVLGLIAAGTAAGSWWNCAGHSRTVLPGGRRRAPWGPFDRLHLLCCDR